MEFAIETGATPDDTRQRIITAALGLFGQVGYTRATTRGIAEAAGVNEVTLFRHFGSKKNLLMACMQEFNRSGFTASFESGLSSSYPEDILHMARLQMEDTRANMDLLRVILCDARTVPELREAVLAGGRGNMAHLSDYFQRQIDAGMVRGDLPAESLALAFDSLFSTSMIIEGMLQEGFAPALASQKLLQSLVELFVRGTLVAEFLEG